MLVGRLDWAPHAMLLDVERFIHEAVGEARSATPAAMRAAAASYPQQNVAVPSHGHY